MCVCGFTGRLLVLLSLPELNLGSKTESFFSISPESCWRHQETEQVHPPQVTQNLQRKLRASFRVSHSLCHVCDCVLLLPLLSSFPVSCLSSPLFLLF